MLTAVVCAGRPAVSSAQDEPPLIPRRPTVHAVVISSETTAPLPSGPQAHARPGDILLYNDHIRAVIGSADPQRRPNAVTCYDRPAPGALFDLYLADWTEDQIVLVEPSGPAGHVQRLQIAEDGSHGRAVVRVHAADTATGLTRTLDYILTPRDRFVRIEAVFTNTGTTPRTLAPHLRVEGLVNTQRLHGIWVGEAPQPESRLGYAWARLAGDPGDDPDAPLVIPPGQSRTVRWAVAVDLGTAPAFGRLACLGRECGAFQGYVEEHETHRPVADAVLWIGYTADTILKAFTDAGGNYEFPGLPDSYPIAAIAPGRHMVRPLDAYIVSPTDISPAAISLTPPSGVDFTVTAPPDRPLPTRVVARGAGQTGTPTLGPDWHTPQAGNEFLSPTGRFFLPLWPGEYDLALWFGPLYDYQAADQPAVIRRATRIPARVTVAPAFDPGPWVATDFASFTALGGGSYARPRDRIINHVVQGIAFAPATEYNRVTDWLPVIRELALTRRICTMRGVTIGHPDRPSVVTMPCPWAETLPDGWVPQDVFVSDAPAVVRWLRDKMRGEPLVWIHLTGWQPRDLDEWPALPDTAPNRFGLTALHLVPTTLLPEETPQAAPGAAAHSAPGPEPADPGFRAWCRWLRKGQRLWSIGASNATDVRARGSGVWRTWVHAPAPAGRGLTPARILERAADGHAFVTNGPFLEFSAGGALPGDTITGHDVALRVSVLCANWVDTNRVAVLVNGRYVPDLDFSLRTHPHLYRPETERFLWTGRLRLDRDAFLIAVATAEGADLTKAYGDTPAGRMPPMAWTNPIFVDVDGNGWTAPQP